MRPSHHPFFVPVSLPSSAGSPTRLPSSIVKKCLILFLEEEEKEETLDTQKWLANHACLFTPSGVDSFKSNSFPSGCQSHRTRSGVWRGSGRTSWSQTMGVGSGLPSGHHPLRASSRLKGNLSELVCSDPGKQPGMNWRFPLWLSLNSSELFHFLHPFRPVSHPKNFSELSAQWDLYLPFALSRHPQALILNRSDSSSPSTS